MLSIDVLNNKPINKVNGQDIVDLTVSSIGPSGTLKFVNAVQIPYDFEMRPDLVSRLYLGDQNRMGMLLKVNCISNPFSVESGDVFLIPSTNSLDSLTAQPQVSKSDTSTREAFRKQLSDRISKVSSARKDYLASRSTAASTPLPPNLAAPGDAQFTSKDGKIVLGANIGNSVTSTPVSDTKATVAARNVNSNLFS